MITLATLILMSNPQPVVIKNCELPKKLEQTPFAVCGTVTIEDRYGREYIVCQCQWLVEEK